MRRGHVSSPVFDGLGDRDAAHRSAPARSPCPASAAVASQAQLPRAGRPATAAPCCWSPRRLRTRWTHERSTNPSCSKKFLAFGGGRRAAGYITGPETPPLRNLAGEGRGSGVWVAGPATCQVLQRTSAGDLEEAQGAEHYLGGRRMEWESRREFEQKTCRKKEPLPSPAGRRVGGCRDG